MTTTLDTNLAALPSTCYGTLNTTGDLILLKRGASGFWPTEGYSLAGSIDTYDKLANLLNEQRGTSREQRKAMEAGSMFGFDAPIAHPDNHRYDVFVEDLATVDQQLADEAIRMKKEGMDFDLIKAVFKRLTEADGVRRQTEGAALVAEFQARTESAS